MKNSKIKPKIYDKQKDTELEQYFENKYAMRHALAPKIIYRMTTNEHGSFPSDNYIDEYLINEKIPREERDSLLLLADDKHIVWLCGHRISEYYKVTDKTADILQINCTK